MRGKVRKNYPEQRKHKKWEIQNEELHQTMIATEVDKYKLAEQLCINVRTVERWLYEGAAPTIEHAEGVANILKKRVYHLFHTLSYRNGKKVLAMDFYRMDPN